MAWLYWGLGGFCLSWASIFVKWCTLPALAVAAWRLTLASLLMLCWKEARQTPRLPTRVLLAGGALLALHFSTWIASLSLMPVYLSVSLVTTSPLWVALLARDTRSPAGLGLAFAGTLLLSAQSMQAEKAMSPWGPVLALVGAWSMAGYLLWARAHQPEAGRPGYALRVYAWAAALLMLVAGFRQVPLFQHGAQDWALLVAMALVPQALGHTLLLASVRRGSASSASLSILLEPVGSTLLAWMLLKEHLALTQLAGIALTLLGLYRILRGSEGPETPPPCQAHKQGTFRSAEVPQVKSFRQSD